MLYSATIEALRKAAIPLPALVPFISPDSLRWAIYSSTAWIACDDANPAERLFEVLEKDD